MNVWVRTFGQTDHQVITADKKRGIRIFFWQPDSAQVLYLQDLDGDENWHVYQTNLRNRNTRDLTPFQGVQAQIVAVELDTKNPGDVAGWTADNRSAWVVSSVDANAARLVQFDLASGQSRVIAEDPHYDVSDLMIHPTQHTLKAVSFVRARTEWQVLEPRLEPDFAFLRQVRDGDLQVISRNLADSLWIVAYVLDDGPVHYYLYDRPGQRAELLFTDRARLASYPLAKMQPIQFTAPPPPPLPRPSVFSLCSLIASIATLLLHFSLPTALAAPPAIPASPSVPVIYCTDLFHPHDDPDDHFDLATLYALPELDVKCIVLDQGEQQLRRPGRIPIAQLNHLTGRNLPSFPGLAKPLRDPADCGLDQPSQFQDGVEAILRTLRAADRPVALIAVGSLRDVAAAWNREPSLLRAKLSRLLLFIGEAADPDFREYNVGLDPAAYIAILRSGLPIAWVPCFDGGLWQNGGHASFWQATHGDLLSAASPPLVQFFRFALEKPAADPLPFLAEPVDLEAKARLFAQTRNLWCTAVFGALAGRRVVEQDGRFIARPPAAGEPRELQRDHGVFGFREISVTIDDNAVVRPATGPDARTLWQFEIRDRPRYARAMTEATADLLAGFPVVTQER